MTSILSVFLVFRLPLYLLKAVSSPSEMYPHTEISKQLINISANLFIHLIFNFLHYTSLHAIYYIFGEQF